jgi:hypothetical protein
LAAAAADTVSAKLGSEALAAPSETEMTIPE